VSSDAERIIGIYRRPAAADAAARGRDLSERAWLDRFLARVPPRAALLDIGCGFGAPIAAHLIARGHAVTGLDTSAPLLVMARAQFPDGEWIEGDMRDLALGRRFDGLLAWDSFFHLGHDGQRRMFPRFAVHAAPGAALMFTSGPAHGIATGTFEGEPLFHASHDAAEYRALLDGNGFEVVAHLAEDPACGGHTVWLARLRPGQDRLRSAS
jgi:trans-aconitate methyltransferase